MVFPVQYGDTDPRYRTAVEKAGTIIRANEAHIRDQKTAWSFMRQMADELISGRLMPISLSLKHQAYEHEREVRLAILGTHDFQKGEVRTRVRGSEIVPYIESSLLLRDQNGIEEIVLGPAAPASARDAVQSLLQSFGIEPGSLIRESGIPYRTL
jgi:hypothetical protein